MGACCSQDKDTEDTPRDRPGFPHVPPANTSWGLKRMRRKVAGWNVQDYLPMPLPCLLSLGIGALGGHYLSWQTFFAWFAFWSVTFPVVYKVVMWMLGKALKAAIEKYDREIIGVDVHIGEVDISLVYGRLVVKGLKIDNPEGYKTEHLLVADRLILDLDVQEFILSRGMHVVLEEVELDVVDATVEYLGKFMTGENNWDRIAEVTKHKQEEMAKRSSIARFASHQIEKIQEEQKKNPPRLTLQKVAVVDVGATIVTTLMESNIAVADIVHRNFSEEVGSNGGREVFTCLIHSITKSIFMGVGGHKGKHHGHHPPDIGGKKD